MNKALDYVRKQGRIVGIVENSKVENVCILIDELYESVVLAACTKPCEEVPELNTVSIPDGCFAVRLIDYIAIGGEYYGGDDLASKVASLEGSFVIVTK